MAFRRELLLVLVAAFVLALPASAQAAPQWLGAEAREGPDAAAAPARVAADAEGNSAAVWVGANGEVNAAYRPHGGPWGAAENLEPGVAASTFDSPRIVASPDGELVAVWLVADESGYLLRWAARPPGGEWADPATITSLTPCCALIVALVVDGDGNVTVVGDDEGDISFTRPPGGDWGPEEDVPTARRGRYAAAPDGSLVAVAENFCVETPCIEAAYRPPGGPWNPGIEIAALTPDADVTGLAVTAAPDSSFTVVWGEGTPSEGTIPPGAVRASDRSPGSSGSWVAGPSPIAVLPGDLPGCPSGDDGCLDVVAGADGTRVAAWQQHGDGEDRISAAVRPPGEDWGPVERVGATGANDADPAAAITTGGIPVVTWAAYSQLSRGIPVGSAARGAHRSGAAWTEEDLGTPTTGVVYLDDVAADGEGNALTAWTDSNGAFTAGFDAVGPRFSPFAFPSGPAGQALAFSAAAQDNWSGPASLAWLFGDGGGATGSPVAHAYAAPGNYTATVTATDGVGNATQVQGQVPVGAAPTPIPTAVPTPGPDPCGTTDTDRDGIENGCDESNGAARPRPFRTVNATVVSGEVFVKLPAGSASASQAKPPKGFARLEGAETIPVGSTLDTARGIVKLRSAATTGRKTQTGQFRRGRFVIRQIRRPRGKARRRSNKLITDLRLSGSSFRRTCRTTSASVSQRRRRSKKRVRRLFGNAKGSFRTSGRNAAATVRGTRWGVQDRCDGTLVAVQQGRVEVRDKVKRKTIILRAGRTYVARARR